jgi:hypothetical protein
MCPHDGGEYNLKGQIIQIELASSDSVSAIKDQLQVRALLTFSATELLAHFVYRLSDGGWLMTVAGCAKQHAWQQDAAEELGWLLEGLQLVGCVQHRTG